MTAISELASGMQYQVPDQDLSYRMNRLPSIPESGFVMRDVGLVAAGGNGLRAVA